MVYWCIKKGLFFIVHPKSEMYQDIWVIGATRRAYFSLFSLNLRCPKRYGLLVHQEGVIFCIVHPKSEMFQEIWVIVIINGDLRPIRKGLGQWTNMKGLFGFKLEK